MKKNTKTILAGCLLLGQILSGCANQQAQTAEIEMGPQASLIRIEQIDSFNPEVAAGQALEVINNNPYREELFEQAFAKVIDQCRNSKSTENAEIIWVKFVSPLKESGKVPPDLTVITWNYHFSKNFISIPGTGAVSHYCRQLPAIKRNLEKEYQCKQVGFEITRQGSPDAHFLNAMYVYNTMWASCNQDGNRL